MDGLCTRSRLKYPTLGIALGTVVLGAALALAGAASAAAPTLYVAKGGSAKASDASCAAAKYASIDAAVAAAAAGSTVLVCPGSYVGQVTVIKPVTVRGEGATVLATGANNGFTVPVSGVTIEGFTVKGATGEGILVVGKKGAPVSHVTIKDNVVEGNDLGNPTGGAISTSKYAECNATGKGATAVPGDCGEGIHLMVVTDSLVADNTVTRNAGGILLTDEFGPNAHNVIEGNTVTDNTLDCGVTLASHSPAGYVKGKVVASAGGVYDNTIKDNKIEGNGVKGQGAGVLLASPLPGGAVYDNTIEGNTISGNGLAGVTLHSHAPGQDLSGNVVEDNTIGKNNLDGDYDFSPHVDKGATGIIVATAVGAVTITIEHNTLSDDAYGVWTTGKVTVSGTGTNTLATTKALLQVG